MLLLLPASESKLTVARGRPVDPDDLSFPPLGPTRAAVLDALIEVSAEPGATEHLTAKPSLADDVRRNVSLRDVPAATVDKVYGGVLWDAFGLADLDPAARRRAGAWVVVISALWGALRLGDRIPPYRLNMCGRLPGLAHLTDVWRGPLDEVLPGVVRRGVVVDARSSEYLTAWRPSGALAERTVVLRIVRGDDVTRGAGSHHAKHVRGCVVRRIVSDAIDPVRPEGLAEALAEHFDVELHRPERPGRASVLHVVQPSEY